MTAMIITAVVIYLLIGTWCARFGAQYLNAKYRKEQIRRCGNLKEWHDDGTDFLLILMQPVLWLPSLLVLTVFRYPLLGIIWVVNKAIQLADYSAKELVDPKNNTKEIG